jgi:hypothetical protein
LLNAELPASGAAVEGQREVGIAAIRFGYLRREGLRRRHSTPPRILCGNRD